MNLTIILIRTSTQYDPISIKRVDASKKIMQWIWDLWESKMWVIQFYGVQIVQYGFIKTISIDIICKFTKAYIVHIEVTCTNG